MAYSISIPDKWAQRRYFKIKEVAEILHISKDTIFRLLKEGRIRKISMGTEIRIKRTQVEKALMLKFRRSKTALPHAA